MDSRFTMENFAEMRGAPVYDSAGEKIGSVDALRTWAHRN
jgi:sporulation protein YlmC with PRC-barrel domain